MRFKLSLGYDISYGTPFVRVDFYKTNEAYMRPEKHIEDICNCVIALNIDLNNEDALPSKLLEIIEIGINQCILHMEQKNEQSKTN